MKSQEIVLYENRFIAEVTLRNIRHMSVHAFCFHVKYIPVIKLFSQVRKLFFFPEQSVMDMKAFQASPLSWLMFMKSFSCDMSAQGWLYSYWERIQCNNWPERDGSALLQTKKLYHIKLFPPNPLGHRVKITI